MAEDGRESRSVVSGSIIIASGGNNGGMVIPMRDDETVAPDYVRIKYDSNATATVVLTLYDEPEFDPATGHDDDWDKFILNPGESVVIENATYEDVYNGVVAETDGNEDADISVTVGGVEVTG